MKNKLKVIIASSILTLTVGCSSNNDHKNNQVEDDINIEQVSGLSQEEFYNLHKELMPKVEELFVNNNIDFEKESNEYNGEYTSIKYENSSNKNIGEFPLAIYEVNFVDSGDIEGISIILTKNIDKEEFKTNGFKFEDTIFYELSNLVMESKIDYTDINENINNMFINDDYSYINTNYENINEDITVYEDSISYTININPQ